MTTKTATKTRAGSRVASPKASARAAKARYELVEGSSSKFWEIALQGQRMVTTYGRIGSEGQSTIKEFAGLAEAKKEHDKLVSSKVKKGYRPVKNPASAAKEHAAQSSTTVTSSSKRSAHPVTRQQAGGERARAAPLKGSSSRHGFDFEALDARLEAAARAAFEEVAKTHPKEKLCAFALYSDGCAMTICPSTNTESHLAERIAQYPDEAEYYRFSPAEWAFEARGAKAEFAALCRELRGYVTTLQVNERGFDAFQKDLRETSIRVLERLRSADFFDTRASGPVVLLFHVSDCDVDAATERRMVRRLNPASVANQYNRWTKSWG